MNERTKALHFASGAAEQDYKYEKYNNQPVIWHVTAISLGRGGEGGIRLIFISTFTIPWKATPKRYCSRASTAPAARERVLQLELLAS